MPVSHKDERFLSHFPDIVRSNHYKAKTSSNVNWNPQIFHTFWEQCRLNLSSQKIHVSLLTIVENCRYLLAVPWEKTPALESFAKPLFPYVLRGHLWMITLLPIVQKSELMQWWGTKVLRHFSKMAPFWTVDIPIPSPCVPPPLRPKPMLYFRLKSFFYHKQHWFGGGGIYGVKQNAIINEWNCW